LIRSSWRWKVTERRRFSRADAEALVGKRIKTLVEFSGVPKGAPGTVVRADVAGTAKVGGVTIEEYDLAIQWDLPVGPQVIEAGHIEGYPVVSIRGGKPLVDWFTKDEYERYLAELV
jgi:hypothetical protein